MLKRSFWLALAVVAGLIVWRWLQQRRDDFGGLAPQLGSFESPPWSAPQPSAPLAQVTPVAAEPAVDVAEAAKPEAEAAPETTEAAEPEAEAAPATEAVEEAEPEAEAAPATEAVEEAEPAAETAPATETVEEAEPAAEAAPETAETAVDMVEIAEPEAEAAPDVVEAAEPETQQDALDGVVGYCVRCKTKRAIQDAHEETTESGRRAARGTCPVCGANMFTFLATD